MIARIAAFWQASWCIPYFFLLIIWFYGLLIVLLWLCCLIVICHFYCYFPCWIFLGRGFPMPFSYASPLFFFLFFLFLFFLFLFFSSSSFPFFFVCVVRIMMIYLRVCLASFAEDVIFRCLHCFIDHLIVLTPLCVFVCRVFVSPPLFAFLGFVVYYCINIIIFHYCYDLYYFSKA